MNAADRKRWMLAAILAGAFYFAVGFAFAAFARWALFNLTALNWNKLAFLISALGFALHLGYEHFRLRNTTRLTTWHVSLAVALGAFGLALAANIHDLGSPTGYRSRMLIALFAWPLIAGVPAFFVALIATTGLTFLLRRA
jgi:vacuolar-type H+-ATPase subunit I/STV1